MMASMHAELPSLAGGGSGGADDIAGTGIAGKARSWLLQRPYPEENRRETGDIASNEDRKAPVPKKRTSAAALVLARKRKRDEQRKKLGAVSGKKQRVAAHGSSEHQAEDDGEDSYDVEQQLTAFVEYVRDNATDMDSLDINPSQDFDVLASFSVGGQGLTVRVLTAGAADVIYAPPTETIASACNLSTHCPSEVKNVVAAQTPPFPSVAQVIPEAEKAVVAPATDDSDASLSVTRDVPDDVQTQWIQRRSVKRDCSFVENKHSSPDGRLLLTASSSAGRKPSSITVIELKDNCFDSSDDVEEGPTEQEPSPSLSTSVPATVDTMAVVSSSSTSIFGIPSRALGFQPRLVKKRRKVEQLKLDGFFQSKQPWT
ncbi:hypothetical protein BBJ28_00018346 [Nothophytophthora sp. Chile5]|nr:hypothetical protein BBJ28_00018346 [Nothophytophthora sp. Chile5]